MVNVSTAPTGEGKKKSLANDTVMESERLEGTQLRRGRRKNKRKDTLYTQPPPVRKDLREIQNRAVMFNW